MDKLDLKHMRIFLQLVKEGNVSKVAEEAGISQQAVSSYLKRLREAFPNELFLRRSSGLKPTDYAIELAAKFAQILAEVDDVFSDVPFEPESARRTVTIIANEYAQLALVPALFRAIRDAAPHVRIEVIDFDVATHEAHLSNGTADVVIGFTEFLSDNLNRSPLISEHYCCVVGNDSKIAGKLKSITDLSKFPHIDFASGAGHLANSVEFFLEENSIERNVVVTLPCYTSLGHFLKSNDVVAFVPSAIATSLQLNTISFKSKPREFDVAIGWHRRSSGNPLRKWLVELAVQCVTKP
ncbi:LysR family transcriptional regulator [Undibacterium curvum]|uniref:LysR family transcriptional regulator n=1 Tax=Undibacterium curvum TaxID=2762294 RepID=UPI003D105FC1